ncbi:MAG: hypothetical protein M1836_003223 [Candelina mexicana]|nr:MAG: hypothetical protein M1836_003223 [Candelina mexicana]
MWRLSYERLHMAERPLPSETPSGPLNSSFALRSSSSRSTETIPNYDLTSFITDHHQQWPSQLPPHRLTPSSQDFNQIPAEDFVLFPSSTAHHSARSPVERGPTTTRAVPNQTFQATSHGHPQRNSNQSSSVASVQNPRVAEIIQGTGHSISSTSFNRFSPSVQKEQFYASSAPSSSLALQQQQHSSTRPPVPLFSSNSTGRISVKMATTDTHQGTDPSLRLPRSFRFQLTYVDMDNFFDLSTGFGGEAAQEAHGFDTIFKSPHFTTINDPAADNQVTVSPQDLFHDPSASAPPSTAFTNLTSPSIFDESPELLDSFETSPLFANDNDPGAGGDKWFSLFPSNSSANDESPLNDHVELVDSSTFSATVETNSTRRKSSNGNSPPSGRGSYKHSSISGVSAKKRDKPLPPIVVEDPNDTIAMKRARNTAAARKSRQKKVEKFEEQEQKIQDLLNQVEHWKSLALSRNGGQV